MAGLDDAYEDAGKAWNVDPRLIRAMHSGESGFDDNAKSNKGALGRGQFMPDTARAIGMTNPNDPLQAIYGTAKLMRQNLDASNGDVATALRLYQGGPDRSKWGPQNAAYVPYIMSHYQKVGAAPASAAAPAAASAPADGPSDDAIIAALTKGAPASGVPAATAPANGQMSDDDIIKALTATGPKQEAAPVAAPATPAAPAALVDPSIPTPGLQQTAPPTGFVNQKPQLGLTPQETADWTAGTGRAVRDVIDRPAQWLAQGADYLGLTNGEGARVNALNDAARQAYNQQPSGPLREGARMAGQLALTGPMLGGLSVGNTIGGSGMIASGLRSVAQGGAQGAAAAALTSGQSDAPLRQQVEQGALIGGALGPAFGAAQAVGNRLAGAGINPEVAKLAQLARDKYGINLTADQITGSPFVQSAGAALRHIPMSGMAGAQNQLQGQFTRAVSRTIGEDTAAITPMVMEQAKNRIGGVMNDVAKRTTIPAHTDPDFLGNLGRIEAEAAKALPGDQPKLIRDQVSDILDMTVRNNGNIPGQAYQDLTKKNAPLDRLTQNADPNVKFYAQQIRDTLDDALERAAGPEQLQRLREARLQYKNMKTIEPLVISGQPGEISANGLQSRVNRSFSGRGTRSDQPDLAELADIGKRFNLVPDSGTGRRTLVNNMIYGGGGAAGLATYMDPSNALYAAGALASGTATGALGGAMLRNKSYINSLISSGLSPASEPAMAQLGALAIPGAAERGQDAGALAMRNRLLEYYRNSRGATP